MKCRNHAKKLDVTNETVSSLLSLMSVAAKQKDHYARDSFQYLSNLCTFCGVTPNKLLNEYLNGFAYKKTEKSKLGYGMEILSKQVIQTKIREMYEWMILLLRHRDRIQHELSIPFVPRTRVNECFPEEAWERIAMTTIAFHSLLYLLESTLPTQAASTILPEDIMVICDKLFWECDTESKFSEKMRILFLAFQKPERICKESKILEDLWASREVRGGLRQDDQTTGFWSVLENIGGDLAASDEEAKSVARLSLALLRQPKGSYSMNKTLMRRRGVYDELWWATLCCGFYSNYLSPKRDHHQNLKLRIHCIIKANLEGGISDAEIHNVEIDPTSPPKRRKLSTGSGPAALRVACSSTTKMGETNETRTRKRCVFPNRPLGKSSFFRP